MFSASPISLTEAYTPLSSMRCQGHSGAVLLVDWHLLQSIRQASVSTLG
jgi:hypothetical protein